MENLCMAWTGIASDLTLQDVIGPAFQPPSPQQPVAAETVTAAKPKPSGLWLFVRRHRGNLIAIGTILFGFGAVQSYYWISDAVAYFDMNSEQSLRELAQQKAAGEQRVLAQEREARAAAAGTEAPPPVSQPEATAPNVGDDAGGKVGNNMSLEHYRELSGRI
jgi:hypothetical protein